MKRALIIMLPVIMASSPGNPHIDREKEYVIGLVMQAQRMQYSEAEEFADAIVDASRMHDLDPRLLVSIIKVESHFRKTIVSNHDYGPMQVNKFWLKRFGIVKEDLLGIGGIYVGAKILALVKQERTYEDCWWGYYNSRIPEKRSAYQKKVLKELRRLGLRMRCEDPVRVADSMSEESVQSYAF